MQPRQYKVTTWPFKGKWNWNVTDKREKNITNTLAKGNGCNSSAKAYNTGKRWIELYRRSLPGQSNLKVDMFPIRKSFRRIYRPIE